MRITKNRYIENLIKQGEHQQLDFKFEIADSKKIARTLAAFANTDGGRLLVGVKDNGTIAGVRSIEEYHMLEAAAQMYCKPEIPFVAKEWSVEGKAILEITIPKRKGVPHKAPNPEGKWMVYIRVNDQNLLANRILLNVWKRKAQSLPTHIIYTEAEKTLLTYLKENKSITLSKFSKIAFITYQKAENIIINFILLNIVDIIVTEKQSFYTLTEPYPNSEN